MILDNFVFFYLILAIVGLAIAIIVYATTIGGRRTKK